MLATFSLDKPGAGDVTRREFVRFCSMAAAAVGLGPVAAEEFVSAAERGAKPSVIWLQFQECTGCTESLTRSHTPTLESLIFDMISLDYHHTLQAASGYGAEKSREDAMQKFFGKYLLVVDGSVPVKDGGIYSTIAGRTNPLAVAVR